MSCGARLNVGWLTGCLVYLSVVDLNDECSRSPVNKSVDDLDFFFFFVHKNL